MKKTILFLFVLSLFAVSCEDKKDEPEVKQDFSKIQSTFKALKVIHDNLKGDASKTPAQLLELYNKDIKPNVAKAASADFEKWIPKIKENGDKEAMAGVAGKLGKRYVNAKGIELAQLVKKGFIGAFQLNGFNFAMMSAVKSTEKAKRKAALDKAVTFLLGDVSYLDKEKLDGKYPVYDGNQFVYYMNKVDGMGDKIYTAIKDAYNKTGSSDFNTALLAINTLVTKTVAIRGVHYLKHAEKLQNGYDVEEAHELSEGLGFVYSLQFAYKGMGQFFLDAAQAQKFTTFDLWDKDKTPAEIEKEAKAIAKMFGFDYDTEK